MEEEILTIKISNPYWLLRFLGNKECLNLVKVTKPPWFQIVVETF